MQKRIGVDGHNIAVRVLSEEVETHSSKKCFLGSHDHPLQLVSDSCNASVAIPDHRGERLASLIHKPQELFVASNGDVSSIRLSLS